MATKPDRVTHVNRNGVHVLAFAFRCEDGQCELLQPVRGPDDRFISWQNYLKAGKRMAKTASGVRALAPDTPVPTAAIAAPEAVVLKRRTKGVKRAAKATNKRPVPKKKKAPSKKAPKKRRPGTKKLGTRLPFKKSRRNQIRRQKRIKAELKGKRR